MIIYNLVYYLPQVSEKTDAAFQQRKLVLIRGRSKTCKTREACELLRRYWYLGPTVLVAPLTAHYGKWGTADGKKQIWVFLSDFVYSQDIKHQRRRRTVEVERRMLVGEIAPYTERLRRAGLSGRINTAFVERVNIVL